MPGDSEKYDSLLPIPTYDEAISSRPSSAQSYHTPVDPSDDAERRGLLGGPSAIAPARHGNYHAPTVESGRDSYDGAFTSPELSEDEEEEELRRDMEQMEVADPEAERRAQQRARMRQRLSKGIASLTETFSNLHLPRMPNSWSFRTILTPFCNLPAPDTGAISWPIVARLVALFIIAALVYVLIVIRIFPPQAVMGSRFEADSVRKFLLRHVDASMIQRNLKEVSYDDHIAGTKGDFFLANWIKTRFQTAKLDAVSTENFEVYLNYPRSDGRRVAITDPPDKAWTAKLEEDDVSGANIERHQAGAFHGLSYSGDVNGPLIYANYGAREDFDYLKEKGLNVTGSIILVRQWGTQSDVALKVKSAELAGAVGCIIYSDPAEDGLGRGPPGPDGPWRTPDSLQCGSVGLSAWVAGDILTPGWASTSDAPRIETSNHVAIPNIASIPIGWRDAEPLLRSIEKHGQPVEIEWRGAIPKLEYWTGNTSTSPIVQLRNLQDGYAHQPIRNVLGRIQGTESLQAASPEVYIGNHRDAWCFGAVDPGSGTAIFLELVRIFGELAQNGWRPRRSIVFASWDAEEYNLIGSTEHVESRIDSLRQRGVAYINIADAVYGDELQASGSPMFERPLLDALAFVGDSRNDSTSLLQRWNDSHSHIHALGGGGDYVPFQAMAGTSSLDLRFAPPTKPHHHPNNKPASTKVGGRPYPLNSCHDTLAFVETHSDPSFANHALLTQTLALIIYSVSDTAILPFDLEAYASAIHAYLGDLDRDMHDIIFAIPAATRPNVDLEPLRLASDTLIANAAKFAQWEAEYYALQMASASTTAAKPPAPGVGESRELGIRRISRNARMAEFETRLLDVPDPGGVPGGGLASVALPDKDAKKEAEGEMKARVEALARAGRGVPHDNQKSRRDDDDDPTEGEKKPIRKGGLPFRPQFKHVIYGPLAWGNGHDALPFPGIRDALALQDWDGMNEQVRIVAEVIGNAADRLVM